MTTLASEQIAAAACRSFAPASFGEQRRFPMAAVRLRQTPIHGTFPAVLRVIWAMSIVSIVTSICASRRGAAGVVRDGQRPPARRGVGASALVIIAIAFIAPAAAETIRLDLPIDCVIGETCVISPTVAIAHCDMTS